MIFRRILVLALWTILPLPGVADDVVNPCDQNRFCTADYLHSYVQNIVDDKENRFENTPPNLMVNWYKLSKDKTLVQTAYEKLTSDDAPQSLTAAVVRVYLAGILGIHSEITARQNELRTLMQELGASNRYSSIFLAALEGQNGLPDPQDLNLIHDNDGQSSLMRYFQAYDQLVSPYRIDDDRILTINQVREFLTKVLGASEQQAIQSIEDAYKQQALSELKKHGDETDLYAFLKDINFDINLPVPAPELDYVYDFSGSSLPLPLNIVDVEEVGKLVRASPSAQGYRFFYPYAGRSMSLEEVTDWFASIEDFELVDRDILIALIYRNIDNANKPRAQELRDKWRQHVGVHDPIDKLLANGENIQRFPLSVKGYSDYLSASPDKRPCQFYLSRRNKMDTWIKGNHLRPSSTFGFKEFDEFAREKGEEMAQDCAEMGLPDIELMAFRIESLLRSETSKETIKRLISKINSLDSRTAKLSFFGLAAKKLLSVNQSSAATEILKEVNFDALSSTSETHLHTEDFEGSGGSYIHWKDPLHEGKSVALPAALREAALYCIALPDCFPEGRPKAMVEMASRNIEEFAYLIGPGGRYPDARTMAASLESAWNTLEGEKAARLVRLYAWAANWGQGNYSEIEFVTELMREIVALPAESVLYIGQDAYFMGNLLGGVGKYQVENKLAPYGPFWQVIGEGYHKWSQSPELLQNEKADFNDVLNIMFGNIIRYGDANAVNAAQLWKTDDGPFEIIRGFENNPSIMTPEQIVEFAGITFKNPDADPRVTEEIDRTISAAGQPKTLEGTQITDAFREALLNARGITGEIRLEDALKTYAEYGLMAEAGIIFEHLTDEQISYLMEVSPDDYLARFPMVSLSKEAYFKRVISLDQTHRFLSYVVGEAAKRSPAQ